MLTIPSLVLEILISWQTVQEKNVKFNIFDVLCSF
jgi:hypothetical protein